MATTRIVYDIKKKSLISNENIYTGISFYNEVDAIDFVENYCPQNDDYFYYVDTRIDDYQKTKDALSHSGWLSFKKDNENIYLPFEMTFKILAKDEKDGIYKFTTAKINIFLLKDILNSIEVTNLFSSESQLKQKQKENATVRGIVKIKDKTYYVDIPFSQYLELGNLYTLFEEKIKTFIKTSSENDGNEMQ